MGRGDGSSQTNTNILYDKVPRRQIAPLWPAALDRYTLSTTVAANLQQAWLGALDQAAIASGYLKPELETGTETLPPLARVVALIGAPQAGKDYLAEYLLGRYQGVQCLEYSANIVTEVNQALSGSGHVINPANKSLAHYRLLLQEWATARRWQNKNYWVEKLAVEIDGLLANPDLSLLLLSGARTSPDIELAHSHQGQVWKVVRPENDYHSEHFLEHGIDQLPFDLEISNAVEGNLQAFEGAIEATLRSPQAASAHQ